MERDPLPGQPVQFTENLSLGILSGTNPGKGRSYDATNLREA